MLGIFSRWGWFSLGFGGWEIFVFRGWGGFDGDLEGFFRSGGGFDRDFEGFFRGGGGFDGDLEGGQSGRAGKARAGCSLHFLLSPSVSKDFSIFVVVRIRQQIFCRSSVREVKVRK